MAATGVKRPSVLLSPELVVLIEPGTDLPPTFLVAHARNVGASVEQAWVSAFQQSASKPAGQRSVSVFDDEDELRGPSVNVRFGSKADIQRYPLQCPLLGAKRTLAGA